MLKLACNVLCLLIEVKLYDCIAGRGYDPTVTGRPRMSSDSSWERNERGFDSSNWRSAGHEEDDDGWRVSGARPLDKSERWRGIRHSV